MTKAERRQKRDQLIVSAAMKQLDKERDRYRFYGRPSIDDIACHLLGMTPGVVRVNRGQALEVIRIYLGGKLPDLPCPKPLKPSKKSKAARTVKKPAYPESLRSRLYPLAAVLFAQPDFKKRLMEMLRDKLASTEKRYQQALFSSFCGSQQLVIQKAANGKDFYQSHAWKTIRYAALKRANGFCVCCGAKGVTLHVDHVIPRSKAPELELEIENLQVLCSDCNEGKGNWDQTDWRKSDSILA
jgi:hypothetical protein